MTTLKNLMTFFVQINAKQYEALFRQIIHEFVNMFIYDYIKNINKEEHCLINLLYFMLVIPISH